MKCSLNCSIIVKLCMYNGIRLGESAEKHQHCYKICSLPLATYIQAACTGMQVRVDEFVVINSFVIHAFYSQIFGGDMITKLSFGHMLQDTNECDMF